MRRAESWRCPCATPPYLRAFLAVEDSAKLQGSVELRRSPFPTSPRLSPLSAVHRTGTWRTCSNAEVQANIEPPRKNQAWRLKKSVWKFSQDPADQNCVQTCRSKEERALTRGHVRRRWYSRVVIARQQCAVPSKCSSFESPSQSSDQLTEADLAEHRAEHGGGLSSTSCSWAAAGALDALQNGAVKTRARLCVMRPGFARK